MSELLVAARLQALSHHPLMVTWHENRSLYLRIQKESCHYHFHLHRLFLEAPSPVLEALIRFGVQGKKKDRAVVRQMANLYFSSHREIAPPLDPQGHFYDLKAIYDSHVQEYGLDIGAQIGWFAIPSYRKFRSMTFGTYDRHRGQIHLNRLLDSEHVPSYFVSFIVYHEMLHAVCSPIISISGRTMVHTRQFRQREREFSQFELAKEWEQKSIQFFKKRIRHGRT